MKTTRKLQYAFLIVLPLSVSGCSTQVSAPTQSCSNAFDSASAGIEELYETHPMYGAEYDAIYSDGNITVEEQAQIDSWLNDSDAKYEALIAPLYQACETAEDFYSGAYWQGDKADWGVQGNEVITDEESKLIFLSSYCRGHENEPACISGE